MFTTLVVPLDGSEFSARGLPVAAALARQADARVRVVAVARSGGELDWVYNHARDSAKGQDPLIDDVEVFIDPDPTRVLLEIANDPGNLLCFASHDHLKVVAEVEHSVGSRLIEDASHPFLVVGERAEAQSPSDVVVAVDGRSDPERLLAAAVSWARQLRARIRLVTVYEPVLPDLADGTHFTRQHGPPCDPDTYLETLRRRAIALGATSVRAVAISDPVSVTTGLEQHLVFDPAGTLVVGRRHRGAHIGPGVLRRLLPKVSAPLLVVNECA